MVRCDAVPGRALSLAAVLTCLLPAGAVAATPGSSLRLSGLKGVKVAAVGGTVPEGTRFVVPFAGTPSPTRVTHAPAAGLRLTAGRRSLELTGLRLQGRTLSAAVGRTRVSLFTASRAPLTATPTRSVDLRLTASGRTALRTRLRLRRVPAGKVGTLSVALPAAAPVSAPPVATAPAPAATPAPVVVRATPTPTATPVPPPPADRIFIPGVAAGVVTANAVDWAFRGSWLRYLVAGGGTVQTAGGAAKTPDGSFVYPGGGGTFDLTSGWSLKHGGTVTFVHPSHGISIALGEPIVELSPAPRISVVLTDSSAGGIPGGEASGGDGASRRINFGTLDLSAVTPIVSGDAVTWTSVPVLLTAEGAAPFLAYRAGEPFGQITVRATIPPA